MNKLKIFPSVGIARVGNSDSFFLCPEKEGSNGVEIADDGSETEIVNYKDSHGKVKKQGARFKVYEETSPGNFTLYNLPANTEIKWTVRLVNKKTAVDRSGDAPPTTPPQSIPLKPNSKDLTIDSEDVSVDKTVTAAYSKKLAGKIKLNGNEKAVTLGAAFTDKDQNLVVLGGNGIAEGSPAITNFYDNPGWYDDTSDGYIKAQLIIPGATPVDIEGAWLMVGPPDFAPGLKSVVTLYDQLYNIAVKKFGYKVEHPKSYKLQVLPILQKFQKVIWVEMDSNFQIENSDYDFEALANNSTTNTDVVANRNDVRSQVYDIKLAGHPANIDPVTGANYKFLYTALQNQFLDDWKDGKMDSDYNTTITEEKDTASYLNKVALETTTGQGFFPGIEGGMILCNENIYDSAFTIKPGTIEPGDINALMALPWQADFLECADNWWPTQRPYQVRPDINQIAQVKQWQRPMANSTSANYDGENLVKNYYRLAFIKEKTNATGDVVYVEDERDATLKTRQDLL